MKAPSALTQPPTVPSVETAPRVVASTPHAAYSDRWNPPADSGFKEVLGAFVLAVIISLPILGLGGWFIHTIQTEKETARLARQAQIESLDRLLAAAPGATLPVDAAARGRDLFLSACAACHNPEGTGIDKLGKDLVHSWFVASLDDDELLSFLHLGRPANAPLNTTRVAMPPKGGRDDLSDEDLRAVATFLRGLQDKRRMPVLPAPKVVVGAVTEADKAAALAAAGGDAELAEFIASGTKLFAATCAACHGKDARGIEKNGKNLVTSTFLKGLKDEEALAFIQRGRDPSDPANTTGVGMPPKGGNPALSEDDLLDIIAYLRSLQAANTAK